MIKCIKYDLFDLKNDHWLRNLADLIQLTSEFYYECFMKNADNDNKSDFKKFWSVTRRLYERKDLSKDECTVWKDVFHVRFETADFSEKESEAVNLMKTKKISSKIKRCKRFKTKSNVKSKNYKKTALKCSACDTREHSLSECWQIFKKLKSERMKLSAYCICKIKQTVENDEKLTAQIKEICWKMNEKTKKKTK